MRKERVQEHKMRMMNNMFRCLHLTKILRSTNSKTSQNRMCYKRGKEDLSYLGESVEAIRTDMKMPELLEAVALI